MALFQVVRAKGATILVWGRITELGNVFTRWGSFARVDEKWVNVDALVTGPEKRTVRIPDSLVFLSFVGVWVGWLAFSDWRSARVERKQLE